MNQPERKNVEAAPVRKRMDLGLWLTILFGLVLLVGFGAMLIDVLVK